MSRGVEARTIQQPRTRNKRMVATKPPAGWQRRRAVLWRAARGAAEHLPDWMREWQFWLVLALGTGLRLTGVIRSPFGSDDALLFLEAARTTHDHLLPVTGIFNSLLALNFPAYTFLLLPFANFPQGMAVLTAVLNCVAVACLYVLARAAFGKWPAFVAGLLLATAPYDTWMSVFIWQQTVVIPITLLALLLAFEGAARRRRHWFAPHLILLAVAIQIYPQTASLLVVTVCAVILGWRTIRWSDIVIAEHVCVLIWLPTVLFELASGGYDLPIYASWLRSPKVTDTQALSVLAQALGPQASDYLGAGTWYSPVGAALSWLGPCLLMVWALALLWVGARVLVPVVRALRTRDALALRRVVQRADWRSRLLLLPWPVALLGLTVRHATPVYIHYVFFITPVIYLTIALLLVEAPAWLAARLRTRWQWAVLAGRAITVGASGGSIMAQLCASVVFVLVLATGQALASSWAVVPISGYIQAFDATTAMARGQHTPAVFVAGDAADPYMAQYWVQRQNNLAAASGPRWASYTATACAIIAGPARPALVLDMAAPGPALASVLQAPGTRLLRTYVVARGARFGLYQVASTGTLGVPGLRVGDTFQLQDATIASLRGFGGRWLIARWTVLSSTPPGPAVMEYAFNWSFTDPHGVAFHQRTTCAPSTWLAGEEMVLAVPVPVQMTTSHGWAISLVVTRDTHTWYSPHLGPLYLETAKELTLDYVTLSPAPLRLAG